MKNYLKTSLVFFLLPFASCNKSLLQPATGQAAFSKSGSTRPLAAGVTTSYYIDNINGNDDHDGESPATAWKTVGKVNTVTFVAGNQILFKAGGSWTNQLHPLGSGASGSPIVISSYGSGARPLIQGNGVANGTVYLNNQSYWEVRNLEITNYQSSEEGGISLSTWETNNTNNFANAVTVQPEASNTNSVKLGVFITVQDIGNVNHIYLHNLLIHGINGLLDNNSVTSRNNGGIFFQVTGTATPTFFNDILVDSCTIHDVDHTGMFFQSSWATRTLTTSTNWTPSTNIFIRANTFYNTGGHALIVRVASSPLMEHNLFDHCSIKVTGNAAFNFNTDDAVWQYNESRYTKANTGDSDAGGIDADFQTKRTLIQYNFLHNNDYGLLITGGNGSTNFNDGTIVRYNLIEKDGQQPHPSNGKFSFKVSGHATNTHVYNNTIDVGPSQDATNIILHSQWVAWPANTLYYNNIIDNSGTNSAYSLGSSTGNNFDYNTFYKNAATAQPTQTHNITGDVKFVNSGLGTPDGFKLLNGSVALSDGKVLSTNGGLDYFGNTVSTTAPSNLGFYGGPGL